MQSNSSSLNYLFLNLLFLLCAPYGTGLEKVTEARILSYVFYCLQLITNFYFNHLKIIYLQYNSGYLNPIYN